MKSVVKPKKKQVIASVYAVKLKDSPAIGMSRFCFYYKTNNSLAEIDEDVMRDPATFKIDPEPCGMSFPDAAAMREWLNLNDNRKGAAKCVGFVNRGKLYITKRIRVETGWGGMGLSPTRFSTIYPNAK